MTRKTILLLPLLLLTMAASAMAADTVLTWPASGASPMLRFTIGKLRQINSVANQSDYLGEALAENLGATAIPSASFYIYLVDKSGKRVGEGYVEVTNLAAGQQMKIPVTAHVMGSFVRMELQPQHLPSDEPVKSKVNVSSTPDGALLLVDGQSAGVAPQMLQLAPGHHSIEASKEGYSTAISQMELEANQPLAAVMLELSPLASDTVVLRDGSTIMGEVQSVTASALIVSVKGKPVRIDRAQVARVIFAERKMAKPTAKPATKRR